MRTTQPEQPPAVTRGVDVAAHFHDIRRLVTAYFRQPSTRAYLRSRANEGFRGARIELEDLVQDVALTIHRRNSQGSAFDPRRASMSKYVWKVTFTVLSHATERRDTEDTAAPESWGKIAAPSTEHAEGSELISEMVNAPELVALAKAVEADRAAGQLRLFALEDEAPVLRKVA